LWKKEGAGEDVPAPERHCSWSFSSYNEPNRPLIRDFVKDGPETKR